MSTRGEMRRILALTPPESLPEHGIDMPSPGLRPWQAEGLSRWRYALAHTTAWGPPGLVVLAGCGLGKTLFALLLNAVRGAPGPHDTLYLVPASAREQFRRDAQAWHRAGAPVYSDPAVYSHEALSSLAGEDLLRRCRPRLLVIDEAHRFGAPDSARWRRVAKYLRGFPDTRVVLLSGSLTYRSLLQYRHLLIAALRSWAPLPTTEEIVYWASVIDAHTEPSRDDYRCVAPLAPHSPGDRQAIRAAYRGRLAASPGVIVPPDTSPAGSLEIALTAHPPPASVQAAVDTLAQRWELPDGAPLMLATDYARHLRTLSLGFQLVPVHPPSPEYDAARRAWAAVQRHHVQYGTTYETPGLVTRAAEAGLLPYRDMATYRAFEAAAATEPHDSATRAVWVDGGEEYAAAVVCAWVATHRAPPLVWVASPALGAHLARTFGWSYHGAGSAPPEGGAAVASWRVHGVGWNTAPQHGYTEALVLEAPANGGAWEQLLARLHRSDGDVRYTVLDTYGGGARTALEKSLVDAEYTAATTGANPRLNYATWAGLPVRRVPSSRE